MDVSDSKIEENSTQNESKGDLDITVDSVKDHLANLTMDGITTVVEKAESSKVVQETVTKVSSVVVSTKETIVNAKESVVNTTENTKETIVNATENAKETFLNATENAKGVFSSAKSATETIISSTKETVVNSTTNACSVVTGTLEQVADGNSLEHALNAITFTSLSKSPRSARITKSKAPTADLEEFNHMDEEGA